MGYIILIVLGYFLLKFSGKVLRKVCSAETTALWLTVLFCWLILDWFWVGAILLAWRYILIPIAKYQERHPHRYKKKCKWECKLEQSHPMGNPPLLAYTDSEDVLVGEDIQADDERV